MRCTARIAGHRNISMSSRYVHPSEDSVLNAMANLGRHNIGAQRQSGKFEYGRGATSNSIKTNEKFDGHDGIGVDLHRLHGTLARVFGGQANGDQNLHVFKAILPV
jgi:hypothetical protein